MKFKNYIFYAFILYFFFSFTQGCDDCPCEVDDIMDFICKPRESTITEFNPELDTTVEYTTDGDNVIISASYSISDSYNIHSFKFPSNFGTSGSLPNDERLKKDFGIDMLPIARISFDAYDLGFPLYFAFMDRLPSNEDVAGDFLVADVDINLPSSPNVANLKFRGQLHRINTQPLTTESSKEFCEQMDLRNLTEESQVLSYRASISEFGNTDPFAIDFGYSFNRQNLYIVNANNQIIAEYNGTNWVFNNIDGNYFLPEATRSAIEQNVGNADLGDVADDLNEIVSEKNNIIIPVEVGDVFFYRAVNGRDFIFNIINIDERDIPNDDSYKRRVSIMFNEI